MFQITLETPEEFRERMQKYSGLYERGVRRKYFSPASSPADCTYVEYRKLTKEELGKR